MHGLLLLYYLLVSAVAFATLSLSIAGALKSKVGSYVWLIVFYASYALRCVLDMAKAYLFGEAQSRSESLVYFVYGGAVSASALVMAAAILYFHRLFAVRARAPRDLIAAAVALLTVVLYLLPGAARLAPGTRELDIGPSAMAGDFLYLLLFVYALIVALLGPKRDRAPRELLLIWTIWGFGLIGFLESLGGALRFLSTDGRVVALSTQRISFSTFPFLLVSIVMIYYFGSYLLGEIKAEKSPTEDGALADSGLSPREREVMALINRGLSNREIAERLFVSLATVKTHAHNIYEKTGAKNRYQLYHICRRARGGA